jgi:hypothetical protein
MGPGNDGNKYEWQDWPAESLERMPPTRGRLLGWTVLGFLLLGSLLGSLFEAVVLCSCGARCSSRLPWPPPLSR